VFEIVETVAAGNTGIQREETTVAPAPASPPPFTEKIPEEMVQPESVLIGNPPDTALRQRLKQALHKPQ